MMDQEQDKRPQQPAAEAPKTPAGPAPESQPAKPPPPPAAKAARKRPAVRPRPGLEREVTSRLSFLRQAARESGHNYVVNLEHDLIRLADAVREMFRSKSGPGKKEMERLEGLLAVVDRTKLKPAKGRRKDLRRIEQAVNDMEKMLLKKK